MLNVCFFGFLFVSYRPTFFFHCYVFLSIFRTGVEPSHLAYYYNIRIFIFVFFFYCSMNIDTSLMNNIQKLFSERIEVFTSVDFNKVSVLTGIVKIALKVKIWFFSNIYNQCYYFIFKLIFFGYFIFPGLR